MSQPSRKYPGWYPACKTCGTEPGRKCIDRRSRNDDAWMDRPHPRRVQATTSQIQKRGLRDRHQPTN